MSNEKKIPLNVIAVEDEVMVRLFLEQTLEELGHNVIEIVDNGKDCINIAKTSDPDLVLMDIHIKGDIDGIETADILHRELDIPIIFLTAHADIDTIEKAARTKPYGYVIKPFNENDLRAAITIAMSRAQLNKPEKFIEIGHGYSYQPDKRILSKDEQSIFMAKKEQLLCHLLITRQGEIVPYEEIHEFVWRLDEVSNPNALRDLIYRLRKKMPGHKITSTVGVGVQLEKD